MSRVKGLAGLQWPVSTLALLSLVAACTAPGPKIPADATQTLATSRVLSDIPFYPQIEDQCGPASLATMLGARGVAASPESLRGKVYIPGKEGSVTTEMVARARQFGMLVYPLNPELSDILKEVYAGNAVLVLQNLAYEWMPRWHFSVVIGYDLHRELVVLRSGEKKYREVGFGLFNKTWQRAEGWAVVINLPPYLPATAKEQLYIVAASELERVGQTQAAFTAYKAAIERWPDNAKAHFAAGNAAFTLKKYDQAKDYYAASITLQPTAAPCWNNLAYSLMHLGCSAESRLAVKCALALEPDNTNFQHSLSEILTREGVALPGSCRIPACPIDKLSP